MRDLHQVGERQDPLTIGVQCSFHERRRASVGRQQAVRMRGLFELARGALDRLKETMDIETLDPNPPATSASNETSVVQLGVYENHRSLWNERVQGREEEEQPGQEDGPRDDNPDLFVKRELV